MFEHVGQRNLVSYFTAIRRLLAADGRALVHTILRQTRQDTSPWMNKYIFPGGYIATIQDTVAATRKAGLELAHEPFIHKSFHYAQTLRLWHKRFEKAWPKLDRARYDERFRRMWNYYLLGSVAAFEINDMYVGQLLLKKAG
jgi:cyclopropane-fatty-acyl-phospholipid synthase